LKFFVIQLSTAIKHSTRILLSRKLNNKPILRTIFLMEQVNMDMTTLNAQSPVTNAKQPNGKAVPKTLPKFYKGMLYATISFIHQYIPEDKQEEFYSKLPLFNNSVQEQTEYFDTYCDLKKIHIDIVKPMLKKHKKDQKEANKPVKEKKPRSPRKRKTVPTTEEAVMTTEAVENYGQQPAEIEGSIDQNKVVAPAQPPKLKKPRKGCRKPKKKNNGTPLLTEEDENEDTCSTATLDI
jgi:hypothetical protein